MKLTKILSIAVAALAMTACSDDNDFNTASDVTVEMKDAQVTTRENARMVYVPIVVVGEANGPISVTVEVTAPQSGAPAAEEGKDFIVTSKKLNIPKGVESVSFEFYPNWERGIVNDDLAFDVKIVKVEGAKVGSQDFTEVIISDVDNIPYYKLLGEWNFYSYSFYDGTESEYKVTVKTPDETLEDGSDNPYYGHQLEVYGFYEQSDWHLTFNYSYDEDRDEVSLSLSLGKPISPTDDSGLLNFGSFLGYIQSGLYGGQAGPTFAGKVPFIVSQDLSEMVIQNQQTMFELSVMDAEDGAYMGFYDVIGYIQMWR